MPYVNTGAWIDKERAASIAALRRALSENPGSVVFDATAALGPDRGKSFRGDALTGDNALTGDTTLTVAGPDPYTARNWFVSVKRRADGRLVLNGKPVPLPKTAGRS